MITEKYFSFSRFGWVLKHDFMGNWKSMFYHLIGFTAYFLIVMIIAMHIGKNINIEHVDKSQKTETRYVHIKSMVVSSGSGMKDTRQKISDSPIVVSIVGGACSLLFLLGSYVYASTIAQPLNARQGRLSYLMLPATMLEKFISRMSYVTIGFLLTLIISLLLAEVMRYLFLPLFGLQDKFSSSLLPALWDVFTSMKIISWKMNLFPNLKNVLVYPEDSNWLNVKEILEALLIYSFFILGGVYWRKSAFLKTVGALFLCFIFTGIYAFFEKKNLEYLVESSRTDSFLFIILLLFVWWLSYRLFARTQIIQPKSRFL